MKLNVEIKDLEEAKNLCGINNINLAVLEEKYNCSIDIQSNFIITDSSIENLEELEGIFNILIALSRKGIHITPRDVMYSYNIYKTNKVDEYLDFISKRKPIAYNFQNKPIYSKTLRENEYMDTMNKKDLIFSIGAAGSGKTYLAVIFAVSMLKKGNVEKIILTRPAVEAGESLGFLPGDLKEKVDPYLRPLYDALYDALGKEQTESLIERQIIEIAPLAYMRGRTLENSIIILDEAQNATLDQLKMFLTRLGFNSKMIVTGDISQVDLPNQKKSGLRISANILSDLKEVGVIIFDKNDVVRHPLVGKIIQKFEELDN